MTTSPSLTIITSHPESLLISALFGEGVAVESPIGITLSELLCHRLGVARDYLDNRIQTIFVNGRTVDHPDQSRIEETTTVALSAAMPGLVGATFRKEGVLAVFRKDISQKATTAAAGGRDKTMVTLKLFNLVARELGPQLLERGVWFKGADLGGHLDRIGERSLETAEEIVWNGQSIPSDRLFRIQWPAGWVRLTVQASRSPSDR